MPIWPFVPNGFAVLYDNLSIVDAYTNPEGLYQALRKTARDFGWVFVPRMVYAAMGAWEFGGEVRMPTGEYDQAPVVTCTRWNTMKTSTTFGGRDRNRDSIPW